MTDTSKPKKKAAKPVKAKMGRPTDYTQDLADNICSQIASGKSLKKITSVNGMPESRSVYRWLRTYPDFSLNYERAKEDQADAMVEEMMDIGNSADSDNVQVARLQIDTRKWVASKFKAKRYGDKLQTDNTNHNLDYADMSEDEIDRALKALED